MCCCPMDCIKRNFVVVLVAMIIRVLSRTEVKKKSATKLENKIHKLYKTDMLLPIFFQLLHSFVILPLACSCESLLEVVTKYDQGEML